MPGVDVPRARRWFGALLGTAMLATGALYWAVGAPAGPLAAAVLFVSGVVAVAATVQAARVLRALNGPLDMGVRSRVTRRRAARDSGRRPRGSTPA